MILLSRLGGPEFALNPDLIERAEATPDTVVTLVGGNKYVVRESLDELINLICLNRARVLATAEDISAAGPASVEPMRVHRPSWRAREATSAPAVVALHPQEV
jgi:flagellar protein FlbD